MQQGRSGMHGIIQRMVWLNDILIGRFAGYVAAWTMGLAALAIGIQVVSRYVFNYSFVWSEELARYLGIYSAMLGAAYAYRAGQHIGVTVLVEKVGPKLQRAMITFAHLVTIWFFGVAFWQGVGISMRTAQRAQVTAALGVPLWWAYVAVPLGSFLIILTAVEGILTSRPPCAVGSTETSGPGTEG